MSCQLSDSYGYRAPDGTFTGLPNNQIYAVPSSPNLTVSYSGTWHPLNGLNPNISGSPAFKYGAVAQTNSAGLWSFTLPYATTETHPAAPPAQWTLVFPDSSMLTGVVPAMAGPLAVDDLISTYGWAWASSIYVAPVTAGSFAKGTAQFSLAGTATITFLSPFVTNGYQIELTPSVDSVDGTIPRAAWSSKTGSGFQIVLDTTAFTGSCDWTARL
jgi:hypothetical protein